MKKYFIFVALIVLAFIFIPPLAKIGTSIEINRGFLLVLFVRGATASSALLIGVLGLLYKADRFKGYVVVTLIAIGLMIVGTRTDSSCHKIGLTVQLCDIPSSWQELHPRDHAEAEYSSTDGFFA
jgi:hypothetical protein